MSTPELSIVIPTHDRSDLLKEMLLTLAQQTYPARDFEVLVVLDGCTDGSQQMLEGLETSYALRILSQQQSGPSAARNRGAMAAHGRVLLFMDDDLLPLPHFLQEHMRYHALDTQALVLGRLLPTKGGRKKGWHLWEERVFEKHYRAMREGRRPPAGRRLYSGNFSLGREHFLKVFGFDERLKRGEDIELGFRLERAGLHFSFNPEAAAIHRGHRSFPSWCNSAYLYGRSDVQLARDRGHPQALSEVLRWYHRQPAVARLAVRICQSRGLLRHAAIIGLRNAAGILSMLKLRRAAHACYSGIFKLQYWQGVADEMGSRAAFQAMVHTWRQTQTTLSPTAPSEKKG